MIRFFERGLLLVALVLAGVARAQGPQPEETFQVNGLVLTGLVRTSEDWLEGYVDYVFPARLTRAEIQKLTKKLQTTGVFTSVKVLLEPAATPPVKPGEYVLHIQVEEKWTTIPVIRGVYGGGTPLRILGVYDIHTLGRLLTFGGEVRKYGDAPPGFVVYGRDPRSRGGRYFLGAEFWRDFRRRTLYDRDGEPLGAVSTNTAISRIRLLTPLAGVAEPARDFRWKYGGDLELVREAPAVFDPEAGAPDESPRGLDFTAQERTLSKLLPTLLYDDIDVDNIEYDGYRARLRAGPTFAGRGTHGAGELELYGYQVWGHGLNLAARGVLGQTSYNSLQSNYFLGGLDSIRGLPDGAIYGTHAAYANVELRHLWARTKYLWIQSVLFHDAGGAGRDWDEAFNHTRSAAGIGARFAVPQVYRMIFRIDYAWSVDGTDAQGITAGMSQFFDPYTPL